MADQLFCEHCKRAINENDFYKSNNLEKYPLGRLNKCKKCVTLDVDNWVPDTFVPILKECDVPYIPEEWQKLLAAYGKDPRKMSGTSIIGRYLAKMQLKQYRDYRYADSDFLIQMADHKVEETMKRQGYAAAEIAQVLTESKQIVPSGVEYNPDDYFADQAKIDGDEDDDLVDELTDEEKRFLRLKWGKAYKPDEWVWLEQLYQNMEESYDIQGAGHEDTLKMVCKTSLKSNQLLDIGDVEGAQKMIKMYDTLMKSGKFTAAQTKAAEGEYLDSIAEFVTLCEKDGFIPRFYTEQPKDRVDETIQDLKEYTRDLINDERNLGDMIENAMKEMVRQENKEEDEDIDIDEDNLTLEDLDYLKDEDLADFNDFVEEEREEDDDELMRELMKSFDGGL